MEYYRFTRDSSVCQKYIEINNKDTLEMESVYAHVRPLGAVGLYRRPDMVLGAIFEKDKPMSEKFKEDEWDLIREDDRYSIYIPNSKNKNHSAIQIELSNAQELIKTDLFKVDTTDYFAFVLTDKWLVVETTCLLRDYKACSTNRAFFKKMCDTYKKQKNMQFLH